MACCIIYYDLVSVKVCECDLHNSSLISVRSEKEASLPLDFRRSFNRKGQASVKHLISAVEYGLLLMYV